MERLTGAVKNYAWGSTTLLAELQNAAPSTDPEAEIWYGAHPGASTMRSDGSSLLECIEANPVKMLGQPIVDRFGPRLPFLLKLLAADSPLSIQAHPSLEQAKAGFAAEEAAGIDRDDPSRSFRDDNHKPELICALTPFEALVGFRDPAETAHFYEAIGVNGHLSQTLTEQGPKSVVTQLLSTTTDMGHECGRIVAQLIEAASAYTGTEWAAECALIGRLADDYPGDPGVAVASLLNYLTLQPGEALYLGAGNMHAYVSGLAIEIMANSDNVLRGGLTPKHIDVPNLLEVVIPDALEPELVPVDEHGRYLTPAPEFALRRLQPETQPELEGPCIVLCTSGSITVTQGDDAVTLEPTEACWLPAGHIGHVSDGAGQCWLATVGS